MANFVDVFLADGPSFKCVISRHFECTLKNLFVEDRLHRNPRSFSKQPIETKINFLIAKNRGYFN